MITKLKRLVFPVALACSMTVAAPIAVPTLALAQSDCACLLSGSGGGPLGSISQANGDVFKTGASGLEAAGSGTAIGAGDMISTGASASATVSHGAGCNLALGPSSQLSITPQGGNLCVRMTEEAVGGGGVNSGATGVLLAGGLTVGGGLLIGLGLSDPASR